MWKDRVKVVLATKKFVIVAASLASAASGAAGSFIFLNKRLQRKYQDIANEEILQAKLFYSKRYKEGEFADPSALAEKYEETEGDNEFAEDLSNSDLDPQSGMLREAVEILDKQSYTNYNQPKQAQEEEVEVKQSIRSNIFDSRPTDKTEYDEAEEETKRNSGKPYIIKVADYMSGASGNSQICLTYYEEDDVVANELDIPLEKYEEKLGDDNLHFGRASGDPNGVYIRNDDLEEDYEVVRSRGSYAQEVAGLRHSDSAGLRKFRDDY